MRKISLGLLLTLTCTTLFAIIPLPGQEIEIPDMSDKNIKIISTNNIQFLDMSFDKSKKYTAGDAIPVTFIAKNNDPNDYTDMYLSVYLSVFSASNKTTKNYGVQNKIGPFFVPKNSDKKIDFQYTLPHSAVIPTDAEIILEANVVYGSGVKLGNIGSPIKVTGLTSSFDIVSAYIKVGERQYSLQEGPIVSPTNPPKLFTTISNLESATSTITPILKMYDRQSNTTEILEKKYESFSLSGKEMREISIVMPSFDKPGVYLGELYFVDSQNNTESPIILIRWIVDGNMATIPSIIADKNFVQKGEKINIEVPYTGAPFNIDTLDTHKSGEAVMRVTVYDNMNGGIISTGEQKINLDTISSPLHFELEAQQASKDLKISAAIIQEGKELVGYSTILTNPEILIPSEKNNLFQILGGILLFLLVLFGIFRIRKNTVHTLIFLLFSLIFLGLYDDTYASSQCFSAEYYRGNHYANHGACGHANLSKATFEPGEDMSPHITMSTEAGVCGNSSAYSIVNISIKSRGGQVLMIPIFPIVFFTGQVIDRSSTNGQWINYGTFYPHTANQKSIRVPAPNTPGEYVLETGLYLHAYYDPEDSGTFGPANLSFNFTVIENGTCGTGAKIYPATATSYSPNNPQCGSGIPSNTAFPDLGGSATWTCDGQYGGVPSGICTASRLIDPITATCTPSPTAVVPGQPITWTANNILGGTGVYSFSWSGADTLSGITNPLSKTYTTIGIKDASVLITSGSQTKTVSCTGSVAVVTDLCLNFEGTQTTVPTGFARDVAGNCLCAVTNYTLTVTKSGTGTGSVSSAPTGITCGSDCSELYPADTAVTLTADPGVGSTFAGWSGACNTSGQVTMNADKTCTATFTTNTGPISGALTASDCIIAKDASTCGTTLRWSTTNPIGISLVTTPVGVTVLSANTSTSTSYTLTYGTRPFYLYNNDIKLAEATATATCIAGTTWNGTLCVAPTGTLTASDCIIAKDASTCGTTLRWSTTNPITTSAVTTPDGITVLTANESTGTPYSLTPGPRNFFLYNDGKQLSTATATATCIAGTTWNGTLCVAPTGTLTATDCIIAKDASTCGTTLVWDTQYPIGTSSIGSPPLPTSVATGNSGTQSYAVSNGSRKFLLVNNGVDIANATATARCIAGTTWNGTICVATTGTLTASNCTIAAGASTCDTALVWDTRYPVDTSSLGSLPGPTWVATRNRDTLPYPISNGPKKFILVNNAVEIASATATATCAVGTIWNGTLCVAPTGTLTATDCIIAKDASTCDTNLVWNTRNPVTTSAVTTPVGITIRPIANDSTGAPYPITFGPRNFFLYNDGKQLATATARATCAAGTSWNEVMSICSGVRSFDMTHANLPECTTREELEYKISCNSINMGVDTCRNKFLSLFDNTTALSVATTMLWERGGVRRDDLIVTCTRNLPTDAMYERIKCSVMLPTGTSVSIYEDDTYGGGDSYQTISHLAERDDTTPTGTINNSHTYTELNWLKTDVTVYLKCVNGNDPTDTADLCTCDGIRNSLATSNLDIYNWTGGPLTDTTIFTRIFSEEGKINQDFYVTDNAGNYTAGASQGSSDLSKVHVSLGIDKTPPQVVNVTQTTTGGITKLTIEATDNIITPSGDNSGIPSNASININYVPTLTPVSNISCGNTLWPISNTYDLSKTVTSSDHTYNATKKFIYCVRDAADNEIKGEYPRPVSAYDGCFADGTMPRTTLGSYKPALITRMGIPLYGYSLSDNSSTRADKNTTFLTQLSQNISTFITLPYKPNPVAPSDVTLTNFVDNIPAAFLKNSTNRMNNNGYYYVSSLSSKKVITIGSVGNEIKLTGPKVVYAEGMDVQINGNITYANSDASLVIIARKFTTHGGNIYIHPSVTNINATLIADGALINGIGAVATNWLDDSAGLSSSLSINGRLFSRNTRGGSLKVRGANLESIGVRTGTCFNGMTQNNTCSTSIAAAQDLERFRVTNSHTTDQRCTLYVSGTHPVLVDILSRIVY